MWIVFCLLAAVSAATVVTLSKIGIKNIDPILGFAIQSVLILIVSWSVVLQQGLLAELGRIERKAWIYLVLAGIITCISSLFSFRALKLGDASQASTLDKVSLVFVVIFAIIFLKEKVSWQVLLGAGFMAIGAILIALARQSSN